MCSKEDIVRMHHILDAAKEAVSFAQGKTRKSLDKNRLIHAYFDINLDIVWQTVTEDLPSLIIKLEEIPSLKKKP